jgi:UDP-glucose 4-epimerase
MRKILVTGGAGYIGSIVTADLVEAGFEVVVYDNLVHGRVAAVHPRARLVVGELADGARLDRLMQQHGFDAVMHFAALIEAGESMQRPAEFFRNNSASTLSLLEAVLRNRIPRLVFSSTAALYGEPQRTPIEEDDAIQPTNVYGESKAMTERMLAWFHKIHGLSYASLRYFNAAGASDERGEDHTPETHLVPLVLQVAQGKREAITIFGTDYPTPDGTCVRDYIHISDLSSAHLLVLQHLLEDSEPRQLIYNLGNGRGFSVREVIEAARRVTGHPIPALESGRRSGDPAVLVASSEKIRRELGWEPRFSELERIITSAWEWRQKHPAGYGARDREQPRPERLTPIGWAHSR